MKLTPEYLAMTPLEKWETLALNGLLGTNEPWIDDMRESLRSLAARSVPSDLGRLEELLAKATKGPWHVNPNGTISAYTDGKPGIVDRGHVAIACGGQIAGQDKANAALIVAMHEALPSLLATIAADRVRIGLAEKVLAATEDGLRQICSGDEGPVILRGVGNMPVRCARRREAKLLLRDLRKAAAFLQSNRQGEGG